MTASRPEIASASPYRALYYRWERERWSAEEIDLRPDRAHWDEEVPPEIRHALTSILAVVHVADDQMTSALVPFVDAAPTEEQQVFLTTQLADEARHTVFLDRFFAEVAGEPSVDMRARLDAHASGLGEDARRLLLQMLPGTAVRVHDDLRDFERLVDAVVLCHLVIAGTVAAAAGRSALDHLGREHPLPGFEEGFRAVVRDHARQIAFGVTVLGEAVADDPRYAAVVDGALRKYLPTALAVVGEDARAFTLRSLESSLTTIGVERPT